MSILEHTPSRRFFISYHHVEPDQQIAHSLAKGIRAAGHEVFIDTDIHLGADWTKEIDSRIEWCDFMVILISEASHTSEMIQTEVRMAHDKKQRSSRPEILPVRLSYSGPLDYELESILGRLQYVKLDSAGDSAKVLREILSVTETRGPGTTRSPEQETEEAQTFPSQESHYDSRRPKPGFDPRIFSSPGGTMKLDDPFYITRDADIKVAQRAIIEGETLVIKAPRQMGKSSLLLRYFLACQEYNKTVAFLDFSSFSEVELEDYPALLFKIASFLNSSIRSHDAPLDTLQERTQRGITAFVEDILSTVSKPVVFAIDEADRITGKEFQEDFFTMLRMWHNNRAHRPVWNKFDLALVISTEPSAWITDIHRSPFNVSVPIKLSTFEYEQCSELNVRYGEPLEQQGLKSLHGLLNGHPYLTRLAFYHLVADRRLSISTLIKRAEDPDGVFGDHLRALLMRLSRHEDLLDALRDLVRKGIDPSHDMYFRLKGVGVVRRKENRVVTANELYSRFFKGIL